MEVGIQTAARATSPLDVDRIRADFPILGRLVNGHPLVYLDSAATSQKPTSVLEAMDHYYQTSNANVHRGVHTLGNEATDIFERAREQVAAFIDAPAKGLVFVRNTTEALNLVASSYARELLSPGDRIVVSEMEHHSNLVPWQLAAERVGLDLAFIRLHDNGALDMEHARELLQAPTKLVSVAHHSNVLGVINDIRALADMAHANGALLCVDAAQSVPHTRVSVRDLDCDFLAFSGHKMCGPMGIGVLWARPELLDAMPPFLAGGSMIRHVDMERSTWNTGAHKFEAGTPDVASVAGLVAACEYLQNLGLEAIEAHERLMTAELIDMLNSLGGVTVYGPQAGARGGAVSFNLGDIHAHDVGTVLDSLGVAIRAGQHCCQPLMHRLGVAATTRASVYLYTNSADIQALGGGLERAAKTFGL